MSDETWDSHDRNTGAFCSTCGGDNFQCAECVVTDAVVGERARIHSLVQAERARVVTGLASSAETLSPFARQIARESNSTIALVYDRILSLLTPDTPAR